MVSNNFRSGDLVIYRKTKHSTHPGPRATNIQPARHGDNYCYTVDKFWIIREIREDGTLLVETRRGKTHEIHPDDPALKRVNWLQKMLYRARFDRLMTQDDDRRLSPTNG